MGASASISETETIDRDTLLQLCGYDFSEDIYDTFKKENGLFPTTKFLELKAAKDAGEQKSQEEHEKTFKAYLGSTVDIKDIFKQITIKCCKEMPENVVGTIIEYLHEQYPEHTKECYGTGLTYTPDLSSKWISPNESSGISLLEPKLSIQQICTEYLMQKDMDNIFKNIVVSVLTGKPKDPIPAIIEYLIKKYPLIVQPKS